MGYLPTNIMKKLVLLFLLLTPITQAFSHYLWIETEQHGKLNQQQTIKVKYGEFAYGETEQVNNEAFLKVKNFELWLISPDGSKQELKAHANGDHYQAAFTPTKVGEYLIYLDNKVMDVVDSSQYNFGIYKPQYHATAKISIGNSNVNSFQTNADGLEIVELDKNGQQITLKVLFKNKPLSKNKVVFFFKDGWNKEAETNESGEITLNLPWSTSYTVEVTYIDKSPGTFNQVPYEFIWNCATYYINRTPKDLMVIK